MNHGHDATLQRLARLPRPGATLRVIEPGASEHDAMSVVAGAGEHDVIAVVGSQQERFDAPKAALVEMGHVGAHAPGGEQLWWGSKHGWASAREQCGELPVVISYYTLGTPYEEEARGLIASCRMLGLEHRVEGVPARGAWERNCAMKAGFVRTVWRELRRPVLWVDADARIRRSPELLLGMHADLAVHKAAGWQFASGTVFLGAGALAGELLEEWERRCESDPLTWDQVHLDAAWASVSRRAPLTTAWLPQSYTRIFDQPEAGDGGGAAVVEHFQASRRLKAAVTRGTPRPFRDFDDATKRARRASRPTEIVFADQLDTKRDAA